MKDGFSARRRIEPFSLKPVAMTAFHVVKSSLRTLDMTKTLMTNAIEWE